MKFIGLTALAGLAAVPASAQDQHAHGDDMQAHDMSAHAEGEMGHMGQMGDRDQMMAHCQKMMAGAEHDMAAHHDLMRAGAMEALQDYRNALVALDASAMTPLFAEDSRVFENGKDEGTFANYLDHHIGPELDAIESFTFSNPTMEVDVMGHMAVGRETYRYDIALADGRMVARDGVATSVLVHDDDGWKILRYHSSSRPVRD